jgi:hypothetical protein
MGLTGGVHPNPLDSHAECRSPDRTILRQLRSHDSMTRIAIRIINSPQVLAKKRIQQSPARETINEYDIVLRCSSHLSEFSLL